MRKGRLVELSVCACLAILTPAVAAERPAVITGKLEARPTIDGEIGETEWSGATVIDGQLVQFEPDRGQPSPFRTVIRIGQTGSAIYIAIETVYSFNPDLFIKLFLQTNSAIDKLNVQAVWVWRFIPPFGSLQVAYQRGTSDIGEVSEQGNTFFTKLPWVF